MKPIHLGILSSLASLGLNFIQIKPVQAAHFTWELDGYNAEGSGYLKFNNAALTHIGSQSPFTKIGTNRVKLSQLANIPEINLDFGFDLKDTAIFIDDSMPINFYPNGDPEFIVEFVDGLGYLTGINYADSQPISMSSCNYLYCSIFTGDFLTTWTGNQFVNGGIGKMDTYQEQLVYVWDEQTGELTAQWQTILVSSDTGNFVFGEPQGQIRFSTLQVVANPEPLTIIGSGTAIGFGAFFKHHLSKKRNKK